jgi:hypothetical protein
MKVSDILLKIAYLHPFYYSEARGLKLTKSSAVTVNDVLCATFGYSGLENFPADTRRIHEAFYKIKKTHPRLFQELMFRNDDVFHYSKELGSGLRDLETARILCVRNPDYDIYEITEDSVEYIKKRVFPKFSGNDKKALQEAGKTLKEFYS